VAAAQARRDRTGAFVALLGGTAVAAALVAIAVASGRVRRMPLGAILRER
jgi:hypothetical protein